MTSEYIWLLFKRSYLHHHRILSISSKLKQPKDNSLIFDERRKINKYIKVFYFFKYYYNDTLTQWVFNRRVIYPLDWNETKMDKLIKMISFLRFFFVFDILKKRTETLELKRTGSSYYVSNNSEILLSYTFHSFEYPTKINVMYIKISLFCSVCIKFFSFHN